MEKRSTVDNTMILFDRVTKTYGTGQKALDDVSLQIEKGEFVFLAVSYTHLDVYKRQV